MSMQPGNAANSEEEQGLGNDNTGASKIKMLCADGQRIESDGSSFGNYGREQKCLTGQAICGIRTQVQQNQGSKDDTALNNVDMRCCDLPPLSQTCVPRDGWVRVQVCNNIGSESDIKCTFIQKVGTTMTDMSSLTMSQIRMVETMKKVGLSVGSSYAGFGLKASLSANMGDTLSTGYNWSKEKEDTFTHEVTTTVDFVVPNRTKVTISQVVASCDVYKVQSTKFFRADTRNRKRVIKPYLIPDGFFCDELSQGSEMVINSDNTKATNTRIHHNSHIKQEL